MANVKISALPAVTTVVPGSDVLPLVSGGITTKATPNAIVQAVLPAPGDIGGTTAGKGTFSSVFASSASTSYPGSLTDGIMMDYTTGTGRITVGASDGFAVYNGGPSSRSFLFGSDASGNVGIGTSSPLAKTNIISTGAALGGTAQFAIGDGISNYQNTYLRIDNSGSSNFCIDQIFSGTSYNRYTVERTSQVQYWSNGGTERMRLDSSGNLGLGASTGSAALNTIATGTVSLGVGYNSSFWTETADGNNTFRLMQNTYYNGGFKYNTTGRAAVIYEQNNGIHKWYNAPSGTAGNAISFTQAMTLDASGNLLVGTTSTNNSKVSIQFAGGAGVSGVYSLQSSGGGYCYTSNAALNSGTYYHVIFLDAGTQHGSITSNGTNTSYNTTSDQRLKTNIVDAPSALGSVNAIKVRAFDWNSDGSHQDYGYIAQELLEVVPEAVHVPADPEEMMGVDFGKLTPRIIKALQELSAELNELKQKVNA